MSQATKDQRNSASSDEKQDVTHLVEHLFRHQSAQVVSTLTRYFGVDNLDLIEDVVQETLLKALKQWVFGGVPKNPAGWLLQTAKNQAIDVLRRRSAFRTKQKQLADHIEHATPEMDEAVHLNHELEDDQLRMMFTCCHPVLSREARVALTLKILCGFSVVEIARAFLTQEATIAQRLVRAKRKIREDNLFLTFPEFELSNERLDSVLEVLYLFFNEGYKAHQGEDLIRQDLCYEAIRLTSLLAAHPKGDLPKVHALLALMLLQGTRLPTRLDSDGNLLLLKEQDRSKWDRDMIQLGLHHLEKSASGEFLSEYHLQAGIAACHATASDYDSTDWHRILTYYDELIRLSHSPVVALNRAVALSMVDGPEA
ncbi:sigma-70 family RNA polymerase sigma factor, partial [candidate division KSB1 bacterium]|nr:sigma-70 family RNA polymerase sigma factor [candidate division KSB1 bacterium]NIR72696.1 sigma-70 family RNA polymerase sigma factor [candidate division KSB1 bacterium]NIS26781.1 sigma-70 family RNA polymerase sigma factor [candidate division KSB1 bacterium]NIT73575.1 sigma-70 family RNA polymerase sigma factor [candidate division KSB1 bacterium]NIU27451.1 sigma-70 family RNA polymerase sigma factor [candidate division KSB1 bacterium]